MGRLKILLTVLLAAALTACAAAPAPETGAPPPPTAETSPAESESPVPVEQEPELPAESDAGKLPGLIVPPESIRIWQQAMTGEVYWELEVTDQEGIQALTKLLYAEKLVLLEAGAARWPDGGTPLLFELREWGGEGAIVEACTYPQSGYRIQSEDGRSTLRLGEDYYAYPGERCDSLLEFLEEKEIAIIE